MPTILETVKQRDAVAASAAAKPKPEYLPVSRLREQYLSYLTSKGPEIEEQKEARRYYHGAQWSAEDIRVLRARRQPIITYNRIGRKINAITGIVERLRQDPKGYPRSPGHEDGAEIAGTVVREILDASDWKTLESECVRHGAIDGISGVELRLVQGDEGDPDIVLSQVYGDEYFYDPRSYRYDLGDARFEGIAKWVDVEEAIELFPDKEEILSGLIENGSDLTTQSDREFKWVLSTEKQIRLVEHWYRHRGRWCWAFYVGNELLDEGESPFRDERNQSSRRFIMFSAAVDHDGDRYGFPRPLKGPQDEINQRRSKSLHLSNTRRLIVEKGTVDDIEKTRNEWARPDGVVEVNAGRRDGIKPDDTTVELAAQQALYQDAKTEIDEFAQTNVAALTQGAINNLSGRAVNLLQQPGLAELGPFILSVRGWKLRVYRAVFMAAQHNWKSRRFIRVTDDDRIARFLEINGMDVDEFGRPTLVNALGALDVDIILDEGPDVVSMMQDTYDVLRNQPAGAVPPQVLIELAPLQGSVKRKVLQMLQPPQPDPLDVEAKRLTVAALAAEAANTTAAAEEKRASVIAKRAGAVKDVMAAAKAAGEAGIPGAPTAQLGIQSAPITPAPPGLGPPMAFPIPEGFGIEQSQQVGGDQVLEPLPPAPGAGFDTGLPV